MGAEIVHEEVMSVVDEEVQCVYHLAIVSHQRHLDCLFHDLGYGLLCPLLLLEKLNLHLFLRLFEKELCLTDDLLRFL